MRWVQPSRLAAFEVGFYFVEEVDGLEGGEVVEVGVAEFFEQGVGREVVEEEELALLLGVGGAGELGRVGFTCEVGFELVEDLAAALDDGAGDTGQAGDVDAVTFVGAAGQDFVQEDHLVLPFAHGDV